VDIRCEGHAGHVVRRIPILVAAVLTGAVTACSGPNPATHFCQDYGAAVSPLYAAAGNYAAAPAEFSAVVDTTMDKLSRLRAGAPDDELRRAFDSAHFALTVFSDDAALAEFLTRVNFTQDDVVKACFDHGVEVTPVTGA
jgi:hypothetical protein